MTDGVAEAPVFPDAVWACVARFCGPRTLRALACTCRQVRGVCAAEHALRTEELQRTHECEVEAMKQTQEVMLEQLQKRQAGTVRHMW